MKHLIKILWLIAPLYADNTQEVAVFLPVPATGAEAALETRHHFYENLNKFLDWVASIQNLSYETGSLIEVIKEAPSILKDFEKKHGFFSSHYPLVGQYTPSKSDITFCDEILKAIDALSLEKKMRKFYIQEILSKVLAYRNLQEGDECFIPDFVEKDKGSQYVVTKVFDLGFGMPAFGLTPINKSSSPLVLYRGTKLDLTSRSGVASILADLDLYGPGYSAFFKIESQLNAFFVQQELNGHKTIVLGYSLGGILSLYTALFFSRYVDYAHSCAFNPPGVQKKLFHIASNHPEFNTYKAYVNQHDPVSKWGFLIGQVDVLSDNTRMGPLKAHTLLMGSLDDLEFSLCDLNKENIRHRYFFMPE
jgi:hypothetical protein